MKIDRRAIAKAIEAAIKPFGLELVEVDGDKVFHHPIHDALQVYLRKPPESSAK